MDTIDHLLASLTNFLEVTISLQSDSIDLLDARMLLDKVIQGNELCALYVGSNADIVRYKEFENAVVKVLSQNENELIEEDLYLLLNKELWNERTVANIMAQNK